MPGVRRNVRPGRAGAPIGCWPGSSRALRTRPMADALTRWPGLRSSPWIPLYTRPLFRGGRLLDERGDPRAGRRPSRPVRIGPLPATGPAPASDRRRHRTRTRPRHPGTPACGWTPSTARTARWSTRSSTTSGRHSKTAGKSPSSSQRSSHADGDTGSCKPARAAPGDRPARQHQRRHLHHPLPAHNTIIPYSLKPTAGQLAIAAPRGLSARDEELCASATGCPSGPGQGPRRLPRGQPPPVERKPGPAHRR